MRRMVLTNVKLVDVLVAGVGQPEALGVHVDGGKVQRVDVQVPVEVLPLEPCVGPA
jgi:hypothetical protein